MVNFKEAEEVNRWEETIGFYFHRNVVIETKDGMYVDGELTDIEMLTIKVGEEEEIYLPISFELDNDREKLVDVSRIVSVKGTDVLNK